MLNSLFPLQPVRFRLNRDTSFWWIGHIPHVSGHAHRCERWVRCYGRRGGGYISSPIGSV